MSFRLPSIRGGTGLPNGGSCVTYRLQGIQQQLPRCALCSVTGRNSAGVQAAVKLNAWLHEEASQHGLLRLTSLSGAHSTVTFTLEQRNPLGKTFLYPRSLPRAPFFSHLSLSHWALHPWDLGMQLQSQEFYLTIDGRLKTKPHFLTPGTWCTAKSVWRRTEKYKQVKQYGMQYGIQYGNQLPLHKCPWAELWRLTQASCSCHWQSSLCTIPAAERYQELEGGVSSPKQHNSLWIPCKAESSKYTVFLREKVLTHFLVILLPDYSPLSTFPPTAPRNGMLFSSYSELPCKVTECCETALAIPQVVKTNDARMTDAARNGVHESPHLQIKLRSL